MTQFDLDTVLIEFTDKEHGSSSFTIRDAVEGVQIFGGIGSGKTSGSGRFLALKYLAAGFGGLVLTAKPDEKDLWKNYCKLAGRSQDLLIIEPSSHHRFNFLEYESKADDDEISITENLVQVIKTVIRSNEEKSGGKSDDSFWENALDMLMFNVINLCQLAYGKVSIKTLYDIVTSLPKKEDPIGVQKHQTIYKAFMRAMIAAEENMQLKIQQWKTKYSPEDLEEMINKGTFNTEAEKAVSELRTFRFIDEFISVTFKNLSEKTRSIIEFSFSGFLFRLLQEPFYSLFCKDQSTLTPEDCFAGKIIVINLPVKQYHKFGQNSQIMFKYIWQRAMEKRQVGKDSRPVFLWADEAQNFLHEHDAEYQATARSSRIATVYISQNLPNYHANMGGNKSEYKVKSFLGTLATKIFHANADIETNMYASSLIGEAYIEDLTTSRTLSGDFSITENKGFKLEKIARPDAFVGLKTGGAANNFQTKAWVHRQGKSFSDGKNYREIHFNQLYRLK